MEASDVKTIIDKETTKIRMKLLKKLKAGPGEENRGLIENFLRFKRWIKHDQTPEHWRILDMPNEKTMNKFIEDLAKFELDQREGRTVTP